MKEMIYIGIGASAGGLHALQKFVALLPENSNTIYIIAQHLLPDKKSSLADILSHHTQLSVTEIEPTTKFHSNHIYVIPPGCNLNLIKHRLVLERSEILPHHATPSVDILFESLAGYARKNSVGIILSGTGHDGTKGMRHIKEAGGITIAQSPDETQHKGMPQSAIDAGVIDHVHNVEEIAANLFHLLSQSVTETSMHDLTPLESIHALLRTQERLDLSKYKEETILRRINKRMMFLHLSDINAYAEYLAVHHDEAHLLYQDILIGVTSFFRDPESFTALETSLTEVLQKRPDHSEFRIWCVACASGEEAYTLGIVISEISKRLDKTFDVRIFATDIDDVSLAKARLAEYSRESLEEMEPALLALYFSPTENGYKVNQSLRQNIVFTHHNLLQDPPFINQDFISCRNFLIYILPTAQKEIFALFHYSLKSKGLLFLGSSESTLLSLNYFTPMDPQHKIYEKEALQNPPKISNHYFSKHLDQIVDRRAPSISSMGTTTIDEEISKAIFNFFAPHCVIVDRNYTMVYKKGDIPVLRLGDGIPSLNLLHNLDELLRYDVKSLMDRAFVSKSYEVSKFIEISASQESTLFIRAVAYPFEDIQNTPILMLYFQELGSNDLQFNTAALNLPDESMMLKNLNAQLMTTREELRFLSDELILSKETTQLMNEELQSSNEELQSSNEELETSNEELQSSNEELHASLSHIEKLQNHLTLIFNSSFDGIMGLDIHARHTFVNVAAAQMLGYTPDELIGKDSHKLWHHTKLDGTYFPEEECPTIKVLTEGIHRRDEDLFWRKDGTSFEVELLQSPIIENGKIIGAVMSFHDITEIKRLEKMATHEHQLSELYMGIGGMLMMALDMNGNVTMINGEGCAILGLSHKQMIGKNFIDHFIPVKLRDEVHSVLISVLNGEASMATHHTNDIIDVNGQIHHMSWTNALLKDEKGNIKGIITSGMDITKEELLSQKLADTERLYELTFQEADVGITHIRLDGVLTDANNYLCRLLEYTKEELKTKTLVALTHPDDVQLGSTLFAEILENKRTGYRIEKRLLRKNGSIVWVNIAVVLLKNSAGVPLYFLSVIRDISEIKLLMLELETEKTQLQHVIEFAPIPIMLHDEEGQIILINHALKESIGYDQKEIVTMQTWMDTLYPSTNEDAKKQYRKCYEFSLDNEPREHTVITKLGEQRSWLVSSVPLSQLHKGKRLIVSSIIDITEIQRKDEIMISQSRQAAMGDMLAMIAHQWRQPLSVIAMSINTLKAHLELEEAITPDILKELIETINKQAHYLSHTIDDFRDFFKPDKVKEKIAMSVILERLVTLIEKGLENNSITLELPQNQKIELLTYPNELLQALINIINNAKDAIKEKHPVGGLIRIALHQNNGEMVIEICDNGGGIASSVDKHLGDPYVTTKASNGTGLGLYMTKIIITKHLNGRLWWSSDSNGSCFSIALSSSSEGV
ncbi:MAG: PAS domain S-box protein [Pseudomonadota bacterium]